MELLLDRQELLDLGEGRPGLRIVCLAGRCWITQAGDDRDHIISNGGGFTSATKGRLIVTAIEPCRLTFAMEQASLRYRHPADKAQGLPVSCSAGIG